MSRLDLWANVMLDTLSTEDEDDKRKRLRRRRRRRRNAR